MQAQTKLDISKLETINVIITGHIDHGKTTLVDELLKQNNVFRKNQVVQERFLDSSDLERERGITILSKNISIPYKDVKINIIDTPGHADFGGEVERVLKMADGVLLLVDSFEGPMPQTRFVLEKALHLHLKPIIVINKIDRPDNRPAEVLDEIYDLFIDLNADDAQLDFPVIYASGRDGWAVTDLEDERLNLVPLLETIVNSIPQPEFNEGSTQMLVTTLDYSDYVGRIGIGRVFRGTLKKGNSLSIIKRDGTIHTISIKQLSTFEGLEREDVDEVTTGDICALVGIDDIDIGDTIADSDNPEPLPIIAIDEPTISMNFTVNTSPFYGKDGKYVTSRHLRERLYKELEHNVALQVQETGSPDTYKVSGRGILHLSILIENMRREGYELAVGPPKVIYKEIDGKKAEPIEILTVDVPSDYSGKVIELVGQKRGEMIKMEKKGSLTALEFHIPSRGLMGLRNRVLNVTSGEGIMHHRFYQYEFFKGSIVQRQSGVLISMHDGPSTAYAINSLQDRGKFFIEPGDVVYRGQILGEYNKDNDIEVHVQRGKKLTNMRASGSDKAAKIAPATKFTLEESLEYIKDDELVEVTPKSIRMRKLYLDPNERKRFNLKKV
ncbi:MAG: translational GTPase TypA [Bacteroidetes bacterium]|nr:translational GTPase TypA [Bacteroidota bacterium]